ncbi:MAG: hypothetical protein E6J06_07905 [Chloroflexi bacterium]|nr:MAG: hypothetical protein E6J06_07905 [Chloroflexota bacterium]
MRLAAHEHHRGNPEQPTRDQQDPQRPGDERELDQRAEDGSKSQAEYQGGCTTSPRLKIRPAPKISPAVITAGPVRPKAQRKSTAPAAAATSGCTPASASPAATAKATSRSIALGWGTFSKAV